MEKSSVAVHLTRIKTARWHAASVENRCFTGQVIAPGGGQHLELLTSLSVAGSGESFADFEESALPGAQLRQNEALDDLHSMGIAAASLICCHGDEIEAQIIENASAKHEFESVDMQRACSSSSEVAVEKLKEPSSSARKKIMLGEGHPYIVPVDQVQPAGSILDDIVDSDVAMTENERSIYGVDCFLQLMKSLEKAEKIVTNRQDQIAECLACCSLLRSERRKCRQLVEQVGFEWNRERFGSRQCISDQPGRCVQLCHPVPERGGILGRRLRRLAFNKRKQRYQSIIQKTAELARPSREGIREISESSPLVHSPS
jgi:hypothetical protein